ncbi:hypothetical protein RJ639_026670 [Escallonia herrerae]|uniref:Uncharacterized protein n=1 Tax=Escallonia herrerae TaxID=1293975 RepID=A0AA88SPW8_9ASTE|nr:hypothetical protein RJ639_026670 [Escallonia herrerae]
MVRFQKQMSTIGSKIGVLDRKGSSIFREQIMLNQKWKQKLNHPMRRRPSQRIFSLNTIQLQGQRTCASKIRR